MDGRLVDAPAYVGQEAEGNKQTRTDRRQDIWHFTVKRNIGGLAAPVGPCLRMKLDSVIHDWTSATFDEGADVHEYFGLAAGGSDEAKSFVVFPSG